MICTAGNLLHRADALTGTFEDFCYDGLNRLTEYAAGNGVTACTSAQNHKTVSYNDLGNIIAKSDAGTYGYPTSGGGTGSRPHALASVSGTVNATVNPNYHYDANGNLDCEYTNSYPSDCVGSDASRKVVYTAFNMADTITKGTMSVAFGYDSSHDRVSQTLTINSTTTVTTYLNDPFTGAMSEKAVTGATTTWSDYVSADGRLVAQRSCTGSAPCNSGVTMKYFIADHLGSVAVVMDATGNPAAAAHLAYDPWGRRRNADGSDILCGPNPSSPSRGFTGHEHIDDACLINMNARLYDPILGRFMAADSIVPDPLDLQSLNRYSYVDNGPLSATDPTGHDLEVYMRCGGLDICRREQCDGSGNCRGNINCGPDGCFLNKGGGATIWWPGGIGYTLTGSSVGIGGVSTVVGSISGDTGGRSWEVEVKEAGDVVGVESQGNWPATASPSVISWNLFGTNGGNEGHYVSDWAAAVRKLGLDPNNITAANEARIRSAIRDNADLIRAGMRQNRRSERSGIRFYFDENGVLRTTSYGSPTDDPWRMNGERWTGSGTLWFDLHFHSNGSSYPSPVDLLTSAHSGKPGAIIPILDINGDTVPGTPVVYQGRCLPNTNC
jgi:RHS repeat-associated protein